MKRLLLVPAFILLAVSVADAEQFTGLLGGGSGYLSSDTAVQAFFNAYEGQSLAVGGLSNGVIGFCGLSTISEPTSFIVLGFVPTEILFVTAPTTDLYLFTCVKASGLADYIIIGAVDNSIAGLSSASKNARGIEEYPQKLIDLLTDEINKLTN